MSPDVAPSHEEDHGQHRDAEASQEGLSAHHGHEEVDQGAHGQAVLEAAQLVLRDPLLALHQVLLG